MFPPLSGPSVVSPPVQVHQLLFGWQHGWLDLVSLAVEIAVASLYVAGARCLARRGRRWPWRRTVPFLAGMVLVVVAVQSGLASYDDSVFTLHVVQHIVLMHAAPILLVLGAPVTLCLQASPARVQTRLARLLHHRAVTVLTHPVVVVVAAEVAMIVYFLSPFYVFSLRHPLVHDLSHLAILALGFFYWGLIVGTDPLHWRPSYPVKLGALAVSIPVNVFLGLGLISSRTSIAPGFHTLADTHTGGAVLWILSELIMVVAIAIVVHRWMRFEEREALRADRRLDAEDARETRETSAGLGVASQDGEADADESRLRR